MRKTQLHVRPNKVVETEKRLYSAFSAEADLG
jgi:hypothetical protein